MATIFVDFVVTIRLCGFVYEISFHAEPVFFARYCAE